MRKAILLILLVTSLSHAYGMFWLSAMYPKNNREIHDPRIELGYMCPRCHTKVMTVWVVGRAHRCDNCFHRVIPIKL
jgi:DNA-directed RNA polymerase subunit RPC12/RpoP